MNPSGSVPAWSLAGYALGALVGYVLVRISSGQRDSDNEALMTAVFIAGPVFAMTATVLGVVWAG